MPRLFIALELPDAVKRQLSLLRGGIEGARWQTEEQYHLTIRFIGQVTPPLADDLMAVLPTLDAPAFSLGLKGTGIFGSAAMPRLLWAGVDDTAPLHHLHQKTDRLLERIGIAPESRKYNPHVTLARFSHGAQRVALWLTTHQHLMSERFAIDHVALYESHLGHEAARYQVIGRYPLSRS